MTTAGSAGRFHRQRSSLTGISSESVSYATMPVYRTTGTYTSPDLTMDCVIYAGSLRMVT